MIIPAAELCRTTFCDAANCPEDASIFGLCERHDRQRRRGIAVRMHLIPEALPDLLRCSHCHEHKPDDDFTKSCTTAPHRRGRGAECKQCASARRRIRYRDPEQRERDKAMQKIYRANMTPEQKARRARRDHERKVAKRAQLDAIRQAQVEREVQTQAAPEGTP